MIKFEEKLKKLIKTVEISQETPSVRTVLSRGSISDVEAKYKARLKRTASQSRFQK